MNLAQLRIAIRDQLTAGGGQNTNFNSDLFWSDGEINYAVNRAQHRLYNIIRRARADFFTRILRSTDSALTIMGQTFTPSTIAWVSGTGNYTLPPDFVRMKLITDLSSDRIRLIAGDLATNAFRVLMNVDASNTAREYLYDILGIRTLVVRPIPQETRNFEFVYEKLLPKLRDRTTGTLTLTNGSTTATFSSTADIQNHLVVGDEIIIGSAQATQATPDPNENYPVIKSIDSATVATLAAPYLGTTASAFVYRASSVSEIPEQHHMLLVYEAARQLFGKGTNPHIDSINTCELEYNKMLPDLIADVEIRQGSDLEAIEPYLEDYYAD